MLTSLTVVSTNFTMIRFLYLIAIGSLFVCTINIFSDINEAERRQEAQSAVERLMQPPSNVIQ
jgi:hypothetical protein